MRPVHADVTFIMSKHWGRRLRPRAFLSVRRATLAECARGRDAITGDLLDPLCAVHLEGRFYNADTLTRAFDGRVRVRDPFTMQPLSRDDERLLRSLLSEFAHRTRSTRTTPTQTRSRASGPAPRRSR